MYADTALGGAAAAAGRKACRLLLSSDTDAFARGSAVMTAARETDAPDRGDVPEAAED